jgi:hypothetical protein
LLVITLERNDYYVKEKEKACLALLQAKKLKYPGAAQAVKSLCNE